MTSIPEWLADIKNVISEKGSIKEQFAIEFEKATEDKENLDDILKPFLVYLLEGTLKTFDHDTFKDAKDSIDHVIHLLKKENVTDKEWDNAIDAAADTAADFAAASAAGDATNWAAGAAGDAANWAAWAARTATWTAAWAAAAANWAAEAAASTANCAVWAAGDVANWAANWADTEVHKLKVLVDKAGAVTYKINGAAPSTTAAFSFDIGEVVTPFLHFLQANASQTGAFVLRKFIVESDYGSLES